MTLWEGEDRSRSRNVIAVPIERRRGVRDSVTRRRCFSCGHDLGQARRMRRVAVAVVALVGCRGGDGAARAKDPVERVAQLQADVVKVRRLELRQKVVAAMQSTAEFRAYLRRSVAEEGYASASQARALVALGLLPAETDLARAVEDAYVSQAAAYYEPVAKRLFVVAPPSSEEGFDVVAAHELTHALQDQHFDLRRYATTAPNADAATARRFVVEGDATLVMVGYGVYRQTKAWELGARQLEAVRAHFAPYGSADARALVALARQQAAASAVQDPTLQASIDAMGSIPATIIAPLLGAYFRGVLLALAAYEQRHGWEAVDGLYANPPDSTEQVLHPERLFPTRDRPVTITLPAFEDVKPIASDVIGELQWSVYFGLWKHDGGEHPEHGWDGDRYAVIEMENGTLMTLIATAWDTVDAAKGFEEAYRSTLAARYPDAGTATYGRWVERRGDRVFIVDNGDEDILGAMLRATKFEGR